VGGIVRAQQQEIKPRKWRDEAGNVYGVEQATRNGRYVVIRTNEGGNRKGAKQFPAAGSPGALQKILDSVAEKSNWAEVPE